ncbi:MAG: hypothetical protein V4544_03455 [Pseudomonadota bacterium]
MKINTKLLISFLLVVSSNISAVHSSMASRESDPTAHRRLVLNGLKERVQSHLDHLEDMKILFRSSAELGALSDVAKPLKYITSSIEAKKEIVQSYKQSVDLILHSNNPMFFSRTFNEMLSGFLQTRLDNLKDRKKNIGLMRIAQQNPSKVCIYAWTTDPDKQGELSSIEKILGEITTDTYQTLNTIIAGLCSLVDLKTLPSEPKMLLRMSPSLWPRIQAPSDDWGHPDEAIFENQDLDLYEHSLFNTGQLPTKPSSTIRLDSDMCPLFAQARISTSSSILTEAQSITEEELKKIEKKKADTAKKNKARRERNKKLAANARSKLSAISSYVDESDMNDLPDLENDSKATEKYSGASYELAKSSGDVAYAEVSVERGEQLKATIDASGATTNETAVRAGMADKTSELVDKIYLDPKSAHHAHQLMKSLKKSADGIDENTEEKQGGNLPELTGSSRATYDNIMSPTFTRVTYADFETLWKQLDGAIHTNRGGGSHRSLSIRGQTVPVGTYKPHKGIYGKNYIKYLKQALQYAATLT